jgi:hypothetical protein
MTEGKERTERLRIGNPTNRERNMKEIGRMGNGTGENGEDRNRMDGGV